MNHTKRAHRKSAKFKPFRISTRIRSFRRIRRYKKPNHWHYHNEFEFSKILIRDPELLWLDENAPEAKVTYEKVHNCESMPLYRSGKWNGMAHFVRFPKGSREKAISFRIMWSYE